MSFAIGYEAHTHGTNSCSISIGCNPTYIIKSETELENEIKNCPKCNKELGEKLKLEAEQLKAKLEQEIYERKCKHKCYNCNEIGSYNCCNICKRNMCLKHSFHADEEKFELAKSYDFHDSYEYDCDSSYYQSLCTYFCETCNREIVKLRNKVI